MRIDGLKHRGLKRGTNILSIDVPKEMETSVKTGIPFIDDSFGGDGITPSMVTLCTGSPGSGKTTLMAQLADAWTGSGNVVLYNCTEEAAVQVRKLTKRLGAQHGFVIGDDRLVGDVLDHCRHLKSENTEKHLLLIVDSLQSHDDGKYSSGHTNTMSQVRIVEAIASFCKTTYAMAIIVGQVTKRGEFAGRQQIIHTVDARVHMMIDQETRSPTRGERIYSVRKNRYGPAGMSYVLGMDVSKGVYEKGSYDGMLLNV